MRLWRIIMSTFRAPQCRYPLSAVKLVAIACAMIMMATATTHVNAWDCTGHMLIVAIAREHMSPKNAIKAETLIELFSKLGPFPMSPDLVQSACWADDLKSWKMSLMSSWHYIDLPYTPEVPCVGSSRDVRGNTTLLGDRGCAPSAEACASNVVTSVKGLILSLQAKQLRLYLAQFDLVNLVHFFGDAHQPLHAASRYTAAYPNGDRGGNDVHVTVHGRRTNLHALWDEMCVSENGFDPVRPLSHESYGELLRLANRLDNTYPVDPALVNVTDVAAIVQESHEFAVNTSYHGVDENDGTLSDEYLVRCRAVAESRIVLAGYRLATLLDSILDKL